MRRSLAPLQHPDCGSRYVPSVTDYRFARAEQLVALTDMDGRVITQRECPIGFRKGNGPMGKSHPLPPSAMMFDENMIRFN